MEKETSVTIDLDDDCVSMHMRLETNQLINSKSYLFFIYKIIPDLILKVVDLDSTVISKLSEMNMENHFLNTFLNSDFLVIEEKDEKIGKCIQSEYIYRF